MHSISPVKKSMNNKKYFNVTLKTESAETRAVCFSPEKHKLIEGFVESKSPVKIEKFSRNLFRGTEDIIIRKNTMVTPVNPDDVTFSCPKSIATDKQLKSLGEVTAIIEGQLITVKAKVASLSSVKQQQTKLGGALKKQDVIIHDEITSMSVLLWEDNVDCVEAGKTYIFRNLKVRVYRSNIYLNTPQSGEFKCEETDDFGNELADVEENVLACSSSSFAGTIIGVFKVNKVLSCMGCKKKVDVETSTKFVRCAFCKMSFKVESGYTKWYANVAFKDGSGENTVRLSIFHQNIVSLLSIIDSDLDASRICENELIEALLGCSKTFNFVYDNVESVLLEITE